MNTIENETLKAALLNLQEGIQDLRVHSTLRTLEGDLQIRPNAVCVDDLRTRNGSYPFTTISVVFKEQSREDYLAWVRAWKQVMATLVKSVRQAKGLSGQARALRRQNPEITRTPAAAANIAVLENSANTAWGAHREHTQTVGAAFQGVYYHTDIARFLLALRKAGKIHAGRAWAAEHAAKAA